MSIEHGQQELRQTATEAFMESMDQLGRSLQVDEENMLPQPSAPLDDRSSQTPPEGCSTPMDAKALEEAVADIEQFMQAKQSTVEE